MVSIRRIFFAALICALPFLASGDTQIPEITNLDEIAKALKVADFKGKKFSRKIKIAILDNGFNGWEAQKGKSLPQDTDYFPGKESDADKITDPSFHGLFMAELVAKLIKASGAEADYKLDLYNAFGITKLNDAVDKVIAGGYDVVLYSQVWEFGGNGDSKGFINAIVDKAVKAGVIWINAAGNFGHLMRVAPVDGKADGADEWVVFKGKTADGALITCKPQPPIPTCPLRLVLAWNDFKDDKDQGTDKDLDLFLYDKSSKQVAASERHQKLKEDDQDKLASIIPREMIETDLKAGTYKARVKVKSKNFSASQDELRFTVTGPGLEIAEPTEGETILPPADNTGVIVIGASDDIQTSVSKKMGLPHVYLRSLTKLKDGSLPIGSSNSAAMAAALTALNLGTGTDKTKDAVLAKLKELGLKPNEKPAISGGPRGPKIPVAPGGEPQQPVRPRPVQPNPRPNPQQNPQTGQPYPQQGGQYPQYPRQAGQPAYPQQGGYPQPGYPQQPGYPGQQTMPATGRAYLPGSFGTLPCSQLGALPYRHPLADRVLAQGDAILLSLGGRIVISINYDFAQTNGVYPRAGQRIFLTPQGIVLLNEQQISYGLPSDYIEVVTAGLAVCR
jgi:hypothetical protein